MIPLFVDRVFETVEKNKSKNHNVGIKFPCAGYSIRVIAKKAEEFPRILETIVLRYDPSFDLKSVTTIPSRHGNYQSFRFEIIATGEMQLKALQLELLSTGIVKFVI